MARLLNIVALLLVSGHTLLFAQNFWQSTGGPAHGPVAALVFHPDGTLFAGTGGGGVYKSTNGGTTWDPWIGGLGSLNISSLTVTPAGTLIAGTEGGIFRLPNQATVWFQTNLAGTSVRSVAARSNTEIYAGRSGLGIYKSTDDGITWNPTPMDVSTPSSFAFGTGQGVVLAGTDIGVYLSTDAGATWNPINNGLTSTNIQSVLVTPTRDIFAGTDTAGIFKSTNNGANWFAADIGVSNPNIRSLALNTLGHIFAGTFGGVFRSTNAGALWRPVNSGLSDPVILSLATNAAGVMFAGAGSGNGIVFRSVESTSGTFTVVQPNGGEDWQIGSTQQVQWTSVNITGGVRIELTRNGGASYTILVDSTGNTGSYPFTVTSPATTQARVRVSSHVDPVLLDSSNAVFSISSSTPASVTVVSPNGGEVWQIAGIDTIRWTSSGVSGNARIEISRDGGATFAAIDTNALNSGVYPWRVTPPQTARARIRVVIPRVGAPPVIDTSDNDFSISSLSVNVPDSVVSGSSPVITVQPPAGYNPTVARLFVRNGGKTAYDSLDMAPSGLNFQAAIPPAYINIRGIEFYVLLSDGQTPITYPDSLPARLPAAIRVQVQNVVSPLPFERLHYKMVSVPVELADPSLTATFADDYGPYNRSTWRLFRWEQGGYVEFPGIAATARPGTALWLITQTGIQFDVDQGLSVSTRLPHVMTIPPGWSQLADPFAFRIDWNTVAGGSALSGPYLYERGAFRAASVRVLQPWEGYFVFNDSTRPVTIAIPTVEADSSLPLVNEWPAGNGFSLRFSASASGSGLAAAENVVGFVGESAGPCSLVEPPFIVDEFIRLSVVDGGRNLLVSLKEIPAEGSFWDMNLSTTLHNQSIQVRMHEHGEMPAGFEVFVIDRDNAALIPVQGNAFTVYLQTAGRALRVIIGTRKFAEEHSEDIPLVPHEYGLSQNYPNPFNPQTTITYELGKRSRVSVEIFNVIGQRVRTLVRGEQTTGTYRLVWDGTNDAGRGVSSGVYMYRLHAEASVGGPGDLFTLTRKMILIR